MAAYTKTIDVQGPKDKRGKVVPFIVGRGGGNLKRIGMAARSVGSPTFIRVFDSRKGVDARANHEDCDKILVSSRSKTSVEKAIKMLNQDMQFVLTGSKSSKPMRNIQVHSEAIGYIIGRRGCGLYDIKSTAGLGAQVFFDKSKQYFVVSGNNGREVELATHLIKLREKEYFDSKKQYRKPVKKTKSEDTKSTNSFYSLCSDTDSESEEEQEEEPTQIIFNAESTKDEEEEEENPTSLFAWERQMKKKRDAFQEKLKRTNWADDSSDEEM